MTAGIRSGPFGGRRPGYCRGCDELSAGGAITRYDKLSWDEAIALANGNSHTLSVPRESLSTQTLDQLIGWLRDGTFKSGSKLPSQNELVDYFGVSRTGVREALQMMAVLNLIEIKPGLGCFVKRVPRVYYSRRCVGDSP